MAVVASVHIADVGVAPALGLLRKVPHANAIEGLRHANVAVAAPLSGSTLPLPTPGRVILFALWEGDDAIDRFTAAHPLAEKLSGGWSARLEPLRRFGSWPGLPDDISTARTT